MTQEEQEKAVKKLQKTMERIIKENDRPVRVYTVNRKKAALVVIDMQNFVCESKGSSAEGLDEVILNINRMVDLCHERNIPVIWVRHNFTVEGGKNDAGLYPEFHKKPLSAEITNLSHGTRINDKLNFDKNLDHEVFKNRYSAFRSSSRGLETVLKEVGRTQLIFAGAMTNVCVESTIRDAMQLDYEVIVARDATAAINKIIKEASLMNIGLFFGDVCYTKEVMAELNQ